MKTQALSPVKALVASLALLLTANCLLADAVSENDVKKMATGWLKISPQIKGVQMSRGIGSVQAIPDKSGNTLYYVVQLKPEGFLLVSADDQLSPVISFCKTGQYSVGKVPPLTDLVTGESTAKLNKLKEFRQSKSLNAKVTNVLSANKKSWSFFTSQASGNTRNMTYINYNNNYVPPLVQSRWNQQGVAGEALYNYYTPSTWTEPDGSYGSPLWPGQITPPPVTWTEGLVTNFPSGCVATAQAQLIRYHTNQPLTGIGTNQFWVAASMHMPLAPGDHLWMEPRATRGGNGSGGLYDFTKMPLIPDATIKVEERLMIGALLYDCGVTNGMWYTPSASGANAGVWTPFGYSVGKVCTLNEVRANLDAGYPVSTTMAVSYTNISASGHAVLCDGYVWYPSGRGTTTNNGTWYYHFNMGWGGSEDAWYDADGIYAQVWDYNTINFTGNIYPTTGTNVDRDSFGNPIVDGDRIISGRVVDASGYPVQGVTITFDDGLASDTTTTDVKGIYAFVLPQATYTLTPSKTGYTFSQTWVNPVTLADVNLTGYNFTGMTTPAVATKGVFSVTGIDAQFVGELLAIGDDSGAATHGFCWGVAPNPTTANDSITMPGTGLGLFGASVSDSGKVLSRGTTYHVRSFATNTLGTSYGGDFTFKTND